MSYETNKNVNSKYAKETHFRRFYWLMHDRLVITVMALIAIDSIASEFSVPGIAGGILVVFTTIAAFPQHLLHAFAVLIIACPLVLATELNITPWVATLVLAFDMAGGKYIRTGKRVDKQPVENFNEATNLTSVLVRSDDREKTPLSTRPQMMF